MAKAAAPAPAATSSKKGVSKGNKTPRNPARAARDLAKAAKAAASGEAKRAWALDNPDRLPSSKADSYSNRKARRAAWRKANPEVVAARNKARSDAEVAAAAEMLRFQKGVADRVAGKKPVKGLRKGSAFVVAAKDAEGKTVAAIDVQALRAEAQARLKDISVSPGAPVSAFDAAARASAMLAPSR